MGRNESHDGLPLWPAVITIVGLVLYGLAPHARSFPVAILALTVFGLAPYLFPACRPQPGQPITPLGWAVILFGTSMVACPLLIVYFEPYEAVLPYLPPARTINLALVLTTLSFVSFCVGFQSVYGSLRRRAETQERVASPWGMPPKWLVVAYLTFGLIGLFLAFGDFGALRTYFTSPSAVREAAPSGSATVGEFLGLVLRPFLGFGLICAFCRRLDQYEQSPRALRPPKVLVIIGLVILAYGTFGYNRGAFAVPMVAVAAVYSRRVQRVSLLRVIGFATVGLVLLSAASVYRAGDLTASQMLGIRGRAVVQREVDLNHEIQVYGNGPQFLGFVLMQDRESRPFLGRTLISAAMLPVPVLGKPFRANAGATIYNRWIYGHANFADQVIPFTGELFIDFKIPGVLAGFLVLGALLALLQFKFVGTSSAIELYVTQYTSMWVSFSIFGSLEVVSQIFVYFFWPIYGLVGLEFLQRRVARRHSLQATTVDSRGRSDLGVGGAVGGSAR